MRQGLFSSSRLKPHGLVGNVTLNIDKDDICPYALAMRIAWNPAKAAANLHAHGVAFSEAATVLTDDHALTREDWDAQDEQRFVTLGMSATGLLLVVVYSHREPDIHRLISAWKANNPQRKIYENHRRRNLPGH